MRGGIALNGRRKKIIGSQVRLGLSSVVLIFEDGTDLIRARQIGQESSRNRTS